MDKTVNFLMEMSERQIQSREFFNTFLLDSIERNFGFSNTVIFVFDLNNHALSRIDKNGITKENPYDLNDDPVGDKIYNDAVKDGLTYFNTTPRIYKFTGIINKDYDNSETARFLEKNFHMHYGMTMAMGMKAYLRICIMKTEAEGDFDEEDIRRIEKLYTYITSGYRNFKKYEHQRIISQIKDRIIESGDTAYLITDDFMNILDHNRQVIEYLKDIIGNRALQQMQKKGSFQWALYFLNSIITTGVHNDGVSNIKDYKISVHTFEQKYMHGIVDRYHWITIRKIAKDTEAKNKIQEYKLTAREMKVAQLLCEGKTYNDIADEMMISYHTVKNHVSNIFKKCGIASRYELSVLME